jgi:hypothetical protein
VDPQEHRRFIAATHLKDAAVVRVLGKLLVRTGPQFAPEDPWLAFELTESGVWASRQKGWFRYAHIYMRDLFHGGQ